MMNKRIALVQFKASTMKEINLNKILCYIEKAAKKKADIIAFPEYMMFYTPSSQKPSEVAELAETIDGNFVNEISKVAKKNHIQVIGTLYEKSKNIRNKVYDTAFLMNEQGKILSKYRKIHLYDALGFKESKKMISGSMIPKPTKSKIGKIGMLICYDLRFPEISRVLTLSGSEILVIPSAWVQGEAKEEHWLALNKTRAIENGCYVIAPDQVGNIYCGRSLVVDPYGRIIIDMKKKQGMGIVDISLSNLKKIRQDLPLLKNRRTDIYSSFI